ncbi:MAG: hypothetical protein EOO16_09485 [Chitinophagaceae bacterium]|nr:MAG: hypothetical protein EOO16_09485 [Chitinophagaceae bacterium]
MNYEARNSEKNRRSGLAGLTVRLIGRRNGLAYFTAATAPEPLYAFCSEALFEKEFGLLPEDIVAPIDTKAHPYRKYPFPS